MFCPVRVWASLSILPVAPFLTTFPMLMASWISFGSAPACCAWVTAVCRQGWQFAVIAAPMAMRSFVLFSMVVHLFLGFLLTCGSSKLFKSFLTVTYQ